MNLELGGNAPVLVTPHANLDKAVDYIVTARINNAGQVCTCPERIFVHEDVHDDFVSKAKQRMSDLQVGDPLTTIPTMVLLSIKLNWTVLITKCKKPLKMVQT